MYLTEAELPTYYPEAAQMPAGDVTKILNRANAFAQGVIGGLPPTVDAMLKAAVAQAFEIFSKGESGQVDPMNGNVTEYAPTSAYNRPPSRQYEPLETVKIMLLPYKAAFDAANSRKTDRGVRFL